MARPGLTGHRKFRRLARALGSQIAARGVLELLWDSCYESGDDYIGAAEDIEHAVGWSGEVGMLTKALAEAGAPLGVGFIERLEGTGEPVYRVHDLWHHAPDYVAKRRKREIERQDKADPMCPPNGAERRRISECLDGDVRPPSPSHSPSHSPGKNVSPEAPAPSVPPFLVFPVVGKGSGQWPLSKAKVAEWAGLYPGLDVPAEMRKALAWVGASLDRRKTDRGMERFLVGWLSRATDRPRGDARQGSRGAAPAPGRVDRWPEGGCPHTPTHAHYGPCNQQIYLDAERAKRSGAA